MLYGRRRGQNTRAVHDVSLRVAPGEIVGLVGESGSGKTTLGLAIAGLLGVSAGSIRIGDRVINAGGRKYRRRCGSREVQMIFQDPLGALDPRQPVWKAVAEALRGSTSTPSPAELLDRVEIFGATQRHRPAELSGGQRQRVTIARALAARPAFLVCDEITSGLDASVRGEVLNALLDAQVDLDLGIIFVSHDIQLVSRVRESNRRDALRGSC